MADLNDDNSPRLTIESVASEPGHAVLRIAGEIDIATADLVRAALDEAVDDSTNTLVFDVADVGFIDSSGLAALIEGAHRVKVTTLRNPSRAVNRLVTISGIDEVLPTE